VEVRILKSEIREKAAGRKLAWLGVAFSDFAIWAFAWVIMLLTAVTALGQVQSQESEPNRPFRFGFSTALLGQFNENDAKAAMKVWAEALVKEQAFLADPTMRLYSDVAAIATALERKEVDGVTVTVNEFFVLRDKVKFDRFIFNVTDGSISDEYLLLVHQDSGLIRIEDLQNRSLIVLQHSRTCLAVPWLDTLLLEKGLKPLLVFCGRVTEETKLTKTVLPVFFRKADACLVTRKGFKTLGELNPQISRQMRVLASSPNMVSTGFFFRAGYSKAQQDRLVGETVRVHTTAAGQQVLVVFQTERLEEHPASVLDSALALLERHGRLARGTNRPETVVATELPNEAKGERK
jgi:hypothetical protein